MSHPYPCPALVVLLFGATSQVAMSQATPSQSPPATADVAPAAPTSPPPTPPRKGPPGWRLAAGGDTEDPTYCRKETVPNSRFQKERCVKLSQLQRQQVLDRRNKEIGSLGGKQCGPGTSWCESH